MSVESFPREQQCIADLSLLPSVLLAPGLDAGEEVEGVPGLQISDRVDITSDDCTQQTAEYLLRVAPPERIHGLLGILSTVNKYYRR